MASARHLDDFQINLGYLPAELQKNLALMSELDSRSQKVMRNIDKLADNYMANVNKLSEAQKKKAMADIQQQFDTVKAYSDDKVQLSIQTYEMVDKQIRRLDRELRQFEGEIQLKAEIKSAIIEATNLLLKKGGSNMTRTEPSKTHLLNAVTDPTYSTCSVPNDVAIETSSLTGALVDIKDKHSTEADMPIDPNEPKFCLCDQVSFGQMIGCDNPECSIEWFHFECVGLITKPKGKWFCPKCVTNKK